MGILSNLLPIRLYHVSFQTAFWFTLGSCAWTVNGIFAFHQPVEESVTLTVLKWTGFAGGFCFLIGGLFIYWEGLNQGSRGQFGWACQRLFRQQNRHSSDEQLVETIDVDHIQMSRQRSLSDAEKSSRSKEIQWRWYGLKPFNDLVFQAGLIQFIATTIFFISVFSALFLPSDGQQAPILYFWLFWTPQVVGAAFLIWSSWAMMVDAQPKWFVPKPFSLMWHVGFWNVIGSVGFWLSGFTGYFSSNPQVLKWGVYFSTYWGSYSFLLGSILQWHAIQYIPEEK
ncbi:hypothetical protein MIR68_011571 [Amoeboaphelidium protococcarum]|nr:hypothetical protein MIR68_011571 [Amoeboaphelidium protococcarum]